MVWGKLELHSIFKEDGSNLFCPYSNLFPLYNSKNMTEI